MGTHSSVLAWEISWTEEPCGLESTGLQRVRLDLVTKQQQEFFMYSGFQTLITSMICKYFLLFHELTFHFLDSMLLCSKGFDSDDVRFIQFSFGCLCFCCHIQELLPLLSSLRLTPVVPCKSRIFLALIFRSVIHFE